jgi:hypothetical protein
LTLTVTGSVLNAQIEQGAFGPTSYIPTTGAAATRLQDLAFIPVSTAWFNATVGSWVIEFINISTTNNYARALWTNVAGSPSPVVISPAPLLFGQYDGAAIVSAANNVTTGPVQKGITTWATGTAKTCLNGGSVVTSNALTTGYAALASANMYFMQQSVAPTEAMNGYIRRLTYWPRVLSDAEMQQVTT